MHTDTGTDTNTDADADEDAGAGQTETETATCAMQTRSTRKGRTHTLIKLLLIKVLSVPAAQHNLDDLGEPEEVEHPAEKPAWDDDTRK